MSRVPSEADRRLRADIPGLVHMYSADVGRVQSRRVAGQNPGFKDIVNPGGSPDPDRVGAVIGARQVVVVAREIPAKSNVHGEVRLHSPSILEEQTPGRL